MIPAASPGRRRHVGKRLAGEGYRPPRSSGGRSARRARKRRRIA